MIYISERGSKEIDFIGIRRDEHVHIQVCVKLPTESNRETVNLMYIKVYYLKYVVCRDRLALGNDYEILIVHIADFLLRETGRIQRDKA